MPNKMRELINHVRFAMVEPDTIAFFLDINLSITSTWNTQLTFEKSDLITEDIDEIKENEVIKNLCGLASGSVYVTVVRRTVDEAGNTDFLEKTVEIKGNGVDDLVEKVAKATEKLLEEFKAP